MIRRTVCVALLALAVVSCRTAPNQLDEDQAPRTRYAGQAGESPVGVIPEGTVRDAERGKDVVFTVEYPTRPGSYPLIVFSHGFGATRQAYVGLSSHWASQGYVVIKPAHSDSGKVQAGAAADAWRDQTPADWRNRVRDVTAILDGLDKIEESYPELKGKIDRTKIGVGGHSYGAFTAMLLGGAKTYPGATSYADPRVKAIVVMSPQGPGDSFGLTNDSFREIHIPTLFMTGTLDRGLAENETPEWRRQAYELAPAGDKWLVVIEGARHLSFVGRIDPSTEAMREPLDPKFGDPTAAPEPRTGGVPREQYDPRRPGRESTAGLRVRGMFADIKAISLAFFDTYLRNEAEGRTALEGAGGRGGVELVKK
jgi:predicted dienelactone hydrolase